MKQGLIAFGFLLCLIALTIWLAYQAFRQSATVLDRGLSAGLGLSFMGMTLSSAVTPIFMTPPNVVTLTMLIGLVAVLSSWTGQDKEKA
jgi:hypothetical protein